MTIKCLTQREVSCYFYHTPLPNCLSSLGPCQPYDLIPFGKKDCALFSEVNKISYIHILAILKLISVPSGTFTWFYIVD